MLFITGDMHADPYMVQVDQMAKKRDVLLKSPRTDPDEPCYFLVAGDFGYCWRGQEKNLEYLSSKLRQYNTILYFIDGNHEDFDLLYSYPIDANTRMRQVCENIYHLQRGCIYTIEGKNIFTFGGADSVDRARRIPGVSWWAQEVPTTREWAMGENCLESYCGKLDYVITHDAPRRILKSLVKHGVMRNLWDCSNVPDMLDRFMEIVEYKFPEARWFFGHHHLDVCVRKDEDGSSFKCRYNGIFKYVTYL